MVFQLCGLPFPLQVSKIHVFINFFAVPLSNHSVIYKLQLLPDMLLVSLIGFSVRNSTASLEAYI